MIASRREFLKLSFAAAAGLAIRPVSGGLYESRACVLEPGGTRWVQELQPGETILGPITVYDLMWQSKSEEHALYLASFRRSAGPALLKISPGNHRAMYRWVPGSEIFIPHRDEFIFDSSSCHVTATVCFQVVS